MNRCPTAPHPFRPRVAPLLAAVLCCAALYGIPAAAQNTVQGSMGSMRTFPDAALRGTLVVTAPGVAEINGRALLLAPGMRLMSPQNTLVMPHNVVGNQYTVNYIVETSTGMLLTAWILSTAEATQPRAGAGVARNFGFASDQPTR